MRTGAVRNAAGQPAAPGDFPPRPEWSRAFAGGRAAAEAAPALKSLVILGAGQMGRAAAALVNGNRYRIRAYGDNDPAKGGSLFGIPVLSVAAALKIKPDAALLAVTGREREAQLERQLLQLRYEGRVIRLSGLLAAIDIRTATVLRLAERLDSVPGAVAELGVYRGDFAAVLNRRFAERKLYLFDTFTGFDARDLSLERREGYSRADRGEFFDTDAAAVLSRMPHKETVVLRKGYFPETCRGIEETFAFVSLDADLYAPTLAGLQWFLPRTAAGGAVLLHDYNNPRFSGVKSAVLEYERRNGRLALLPLGDVHGSAVILV